MTPQTTMEQYEANCLRLLTAAAARSGRWLSTSSCAEYAQMSYARVYKYLHRDNLGQVAAFYKFDYRIRVIRKERGSTVYLAAVRRGYG